MTQSNPGDLRARKYCYGMMLGGTHGQKFITMFVGLLDQPRSSSGLSVRD